MRNIDVSEVKEKVQEIFSSIAFHYDDYTRDQLTIGAISTDNERERKVIDLLLKNEQVAITNHVPLCQDTGMAVVYLQIGQDVHFTGGSLEKSINEGVANAYKEAYLRFSVVDDPLFERKNTFDNTPALIHYEIVDGENVHIQCLAKGFGSENCSRLVMLTPAAGLQGVKKAVVDAVKEKGANACPPLTIGIGIGGSSDYVLWLAKKALLRNELHNSDQRYKQLEIDLYNEINQLNIGPAGLHGKTTCLKVAVEYFPTHIAGMPLGININCHAVRKGECTL